MLVSKLRATCLRHWTSLQSALASNRRLFCTREIICTREIMPCSSILGSAAGGGFPQWNCNSRLSRMAWDGAQGAVVNASPDIGSRFDKSRTAAPAVWTRRDSPIEAVVLTNGDIDHIAGLLSLRERQPLRIHASHRVLSILSAISVFDVLASDGVERVRSCSTGGSRSQIPEGSASRPSQFRERSRFIWKMSPRADTARNWATQSA